MPPLLPVLVAVLGSVLVVWGLRVYVNLVWRSQRVVKGMPSPPCYPIVGTTLSFSTNPEKVFSCMAYLWRTHGNIFQLWFGPLLHCFISEPDDVEVLCTNPALTDKAMLYKTFIPILGNGLIVIDSPQHRVHRKVISTSMHLDILKGFVNAFSCRSQELVDKLHVLSTKNGGGVFNMSPLLGFCINHTLCDTVLTTDMTGVEKLRDELVRVADQASTMMLWRAMRPWFWSERLFRLLSNRYKEYEFLVHGMQKFVHKVYTTKKELIKKGEVVEAKRLAFLDHVLADEDHRVLSEHEIKEELRTLIWAGSTTTVDGLGFFFIIISLMPEIQEKIHEEVDAVFGDDRVRPLNHSDLHHLQYVERCIKESLRLYPPVFLLARRVKEDVKLPSGYTLPKGTSVVTSPYSVHRHPKWFPDPEKFDPDRFLTENCTGRHPFAYIPFSAASRNCVGQRFALMSMKTIVASVFRHFTVLPDPQGPKRHEDIPITAGASMGPTHGARIRLVSR